jgi:hypothetical protein
MAGTWGPLAHQPTFGAGTMLLLTDGTVMCQNSDTNNWWRLTPDINELRVSVALAAAETPLD